MKRFLLAAVLLIALGAEAQAPVYTKTVIALRQGDTVHGACVIRRNGNEVTRVTFNYTRDTAGGETLVQFRSRVVTAEQPKCRAALESAQSDDAATATDESANLAAIAQ
jgi:opacity protein-like surface antigen